MAREGKGVPLPGVGQGNLRAVEGKRIPVPGMGQWNLKEWSEFSTRGHIGKAEGKTFLCKG